MTHTIGVFAALFDADGRLVLVRQSYAGQCWAQPGGGLEPGEAPIDGVLREIREEAAIEARVTGFIGAYAFPWRDNLVLHFRAAVVSRGAWSPTSEITDLGLFAPGAWPAPMRPHTIARLEDAVAGRTNVFRTEAPPT